MPINPPVDRLRHVHPIQEQYNNLLLVPQTYQLQVLFTLVRNAETKRSEFVSYSDRIMRICIEEALSLIPVVPVSVTTPTGAVFEGFEPDDRGLVGVSILRAGESMERVLREVCPGIRIGKILIQRDEETSDKQPSKEFNYSKMPSNIASRRVLLLDPMIATGGSAIRATEILINKYGVKEEDIVFVNLISCPEGIERYMSRFPKLKMVTAAIDNGLDGNKFILPGLGDFGDRYFGTTE